MKIIVDNKIPFIKGVLEPYAEVLYLPGKETTPEIVRDADALITRTRTICNEKLLQGSSVKVIATATIGFDHIDTEWCEANGIWWTNAPGCNSWSVKQYISSVLVSLAARHGLDLSRTTIGVVGVGNVGSKVAAAASALGMKVLLNDPPRVRGNNYPVIPGVDREAFSDLDTIVREADIVTLHVPLTKEGQDATWHLFDAGRLSQLKPAQILINSSRGPVVDNQALKAALKSGGLKAAVLDVWEGEPNLDAELVSLLDYSTPHIAGYSADGKANGTMMSVRAVAGKFGLPLTDWRPEEIPAPTHGLHKGPEAQVFTLDAAGKTRQQVLTEAVLYAYDVAVDSEALRGELTAFERLRGDYPVRREPSAFTVILRNGTDELASALEQLDFKVKQQ